MDQQSLVAQIEAFLTETGMKPATFGRRATNDSSLVFRLRRPDRPRNITLKTAARIRKYMDNYRQAAMDAYRTQHSEREKGAA